MGTPGPHDSVLASLPSGLCCRHTCGETGVTPGPSLALSAYCRTMTLAGHWGRGSQMQHGKGGFWKEEVYAEARIMFSLFQMRPALSSLDIKRTCSYLGKNQERTSTTWDYPEVMRTGRGCSYLREFISRTRLSQEMFSSLPRCSVPRTSF